ncbi:hypothetical protein KM043_008799 [Ampulex compressa]|nr:hypothetical protein KM043_008799 [Ampulex compressa]
MPKPALIKSDESESANLGGIIPFLERQREYKPIISDIESVRRDTAIKVATLDRARKSCSIDRSQNTQQHTAAQVHGPTRSTRQDNCKNLLRNVEGHSPGNLKDADGEEEEEEEGLGSVEEDPGGKRPRGRGCAGWGDWWGGTAWIGCANLEALDRSSFFFIADKPDATWKMQSYSSVAWSCLVVMAIGAVLVYGEPEYLKRPVRPKIFTSREQLKRYLDLIQEYYSVTGRARYGKRDVTPAADLPWDALRAVLGLDRQTQQEVWVKDGHDKDRSPYDTDSSVIVKRKSRGGGPAAYPFEGEEQYYEDVQ